jgi:tRNA modification GTPase
MLDPAIYFKEDTVCAPSTPPGRGAISIVRLSGPDAMAACQTCFQSQGAPAWETPRKMVFGTIVDPVSRDVVDDALCVVFRAPASYTGEDMAEFHCHGSDAVVRRVLELLTQQGIRLAQPGEFTFRAVRNGKMDLAQAEAVATLIDSHSQLARAISIRMLEGAFSRELAALKDALIDVLCELETQIEFPEDAEEEETFGDVENKTRSLIQTVQALRQRAIREQRFEQGIIAVLAGKPNVGKSSLFNRLLGRERAIVTPHPGTTRDSIEGTIELAGRPVTLVDTAGLRETQEEIEAIGVKRSQELLSTSHLVLYVMEAGKEPVAEELHVLQDILREDAGVRVILVANKSDLSQETSIPAAMKDHPNVILVATAATEEEGVRSLVECLEREVANLVPAEADSSFLINARQEQVLQRLSRHLEMAGRLIEDRTPMELPAEELRGALHSVAELDGSGIAPNIMNLIFSRFCIGK